MWEEKLQQGKGTEAQQVGTDQIPPAGPAVKVVQREGGLQLVRQLGLPKKELRETGT